MQGENQLCENPTVSPVVATIMGKIRQADLDTEISINDLIKQIIGRHHAYLRTTFPRLEFLVNDAIENNPSLPDLAELRDLFATYRSETESQLSTEEEMLFPMIRRLTGMTRVTPCHAGMTASRIRLAVRQQAYVQSVLASMHDLAALHLSPNGPCEACHELLAAFDAVQTDTRKHTYLEQQLLYRQATALEAELASRP